MTFNTAIAAAAAPIAITVPDTAASLICAARLLLPHLERGQAIDARTLRAAMEDGFRRQRCRWRLGLEVRLRCLRGGASALPPQVRACHPGARPDARRPARDAGQAGGADAVADTALRGEPGFSTILDADRARFCRQHRRRTHASRSRAGALGGDRPSRNLRGNRRRVAGPQRTCRCPAPD